MPQIPLALRAVAQTAFTEDDLKSMEFGIGALQTLPVDRPRWTAGKGRGLFIVFEGLDRSGKSTQSKLLREHLEKGGPETVKWMCFPNRGTAIGCLIDLYLQ